MFDEVGPGLFAALCDAAERRLGRNHPCFAALDRAAVAVGPASTRAAQEALGAIDPGLAAVLMADAHKALREDPRAILGSWTKGGTAH